jgi:hypothetical protein
MTFKQRQRNNYFFYDSLIHIIGAMLIFLQALHFASVYSRGGWFCFYAMQIRGWDGVHGGIDGREHDHGQG